jgi:hypothetical protein
MFIWITDDTTWQLYVHRSESFVVEIWAYCLYCFGIQLNINYLIYTFCTTLSVLFLIVFEYTKKNNNWESSFLLANVLCSINGGPNRMLAPSYRSGVLARLALPWIRQWPLIGRRFRRGYFLNFMVKPSSVCNWIAAYYDVWVVTVAKYR